MASPSQNLMKTTMLTMIKEMLPYDLYM